MRSMTQPDHHYIVKNDFIINLRKGRKPSTPNTINRRVEVPSFIKSFSQMVNKK